MGLRDSSAFAAWKLESVIILSSRNAIAGKSQTLTWAQYDFLLFLYLYLHLAFAYQTPNCGRQTRFSAELFRGYLTLANGGLLIAFPIIIL